MPTYIITAYAVTTTTISLALGYVAMSIIGFISLWISGVQSNGVLGIYHAATGVLLCSLLIAMVIIVSTIIRMVIIILKIKYLKKALNNEGFF